MGRSRPLTAPGGHTDDGHLNRCPADVKNRAPMRRSAQPADIADMIISLINNSYVTGEVVVVDGGLTLT